MNFPLDQPSIQDFGRGNKGGQLESQQGRQKDRNFGTFPYAQTPKSIDQNQRDRSEADRRQLGTECNA